MSLTEIVTSFLTGNTPIDGFPELTAEQRSFWWRFLVRTTAQALHDLSLTPHDAAAIAPEQLAEHVTEALQGRVPEGGWQLVQPHIDRPGFLQHPVTAATLEADRYTSKPIGALSILIGSKNHERKAGTVRALRAEAVVYALIELQIGATCAGRGYNGSQLMGSQNGATSGCPFMGVRLGNLAETFRHDVDVVLQRWHTTVDDIGLRGNVWALWTLPWDGHTPLPAAQLTPAFIPLARSVRLAPPDDDGWFRTIYVRGTKEVRVADHTEGGVLGDPFTPLVASSKVAGGWKVRGVPATGFTYREVADLLCGKYVMAPSVAALAAPEYATRSNITVVFEGIAYKQGKTLGFHHRECPLPAGIAGSSENFVPLRVAHERFLKPVDEVADTLRAIARTIATGNPSKPAGEAKPPIWIDTITSVFEAMVDQRYLDRVLRAALRFRDKPDDLAPGLAWCTELCGLARDAFHRTKSSIPCRPNRRLEREIHAAAVLERGLKALFPQPV